MGFEVDAARTRMAALSAPHSVRIPGDAKRLATQIAPGAIGQVECEEQHRLVVAEVSDGRYEVDPYLVDDGSCFSRVSAGLTNVDVDIAQGGQPVSERRRVDGFPLRP